MSKVRLSVLRHLFVYIVIGLLGSGSKLLEGSVSSVGCLLRLNEKAREFSWDFNGELTDALRLIIKLFYDNGFTLRL